MNPMKRVQAVMLFLALFLAAAGCATFPDAESTRQLAENMVTAAYPYTGPDLNRRTVQDDSQRLCSRIGDAKLTTEQSAQIVKLARATIKYPESGKLIGDWKLGAALVADGRGQRIVDGKVESLPHNGALCMNCHAMDPREVNSGNVGPSLVGYGTLRGTSEVVARLTYERIFNEWAYFPCSNMPRLGASGFLTPEQITHVVAYLTDPKSPVNQK